MPRLRLLAVLGPGLLIAATGVGAGDLAGGAFAGSKLGLAVLWAVALGAFIKYVLTENLARWQLATGSTLLEGAIEHIGPVFRFIFIAYLIVWSYVVGSALVSASAIGAASLLPGLFGAHSHLVWGILHSLAGVALIWLGNYRTFEKIMSVCIAVMFVTVIGTVLWSAPPLVDVLRGLLVPSIPEATDSNGNDQGVAWTLAVMGGVGGTLTILCYGYWIRERGRTSMDNLRTTRIDLGAAYILTALFGICMVILASNIDTEGRGARLIVELAAQLEQELGPTGRWVFLLGAWAALFSSLLGVWQAAPYLFADSIRTRGDNSPINTRGKPYRIYLLGLACISLIGLQFRFETVVKVNAVFGAFVMPLLAVLLLVLNNRSKLIGQENRNRLLTNAVLVGTILFFLWNGVVPLFR